MTYYVRVYCEEHASYERTAQTTLDKLWIPAGHENCTIRDFVIERHEDQ